MADLLTELPDALLDELLGVMRARASIAETDLGMKRRRYGDPMPFGSWMERLTWVFSGKPVGPSDHDDKTSAAPLATRAFRELCRSDGVLARTESVDAAVRAEVGAPPEGDSWVEYLEWQAFGRKLL